MKKRSLFLICFLCLIQLSVFGQAFKKNNLIFTGGFGASAGWFYKNLDAYQNRYNNNNSNTIYRINAGMNIGYTFPFTAEFAVHNKWGIGASFAQNSYINTSSDKSTCNNFGLFGAFHFVSKEKVELYTRFNFGLSRLTYKESESYSYYDYSTGIYYNETDYTYRMQGSFVKPSFGLRIFFTEHVGIFTDGGIGLYFLNTNKYETNTGTYTLSGDKIRLTMVGAEITAGVAFKL